jgi:NADPH-dependent ferric siderophore reductase
MSLHRRTTSSAHWTCTVCDLTGLPAVGASAEQETALLAGIHDRLHHRGSRTAHVLVDDDLPTLLAAAS